MYIKKYRYNMNIFNVGVRKWCEISFDLIDFCGLVIRYRKKRLLEYGLFVMISVVFN